ncbi:MAG TPA: hypothetical protein VFY29_04965 [Terriglobia bacterium]|nr:hypothetical protein [Terriglobia bacterium]
MFDFSDDEWMFLMVAIIAGAIGAWRWYSTALRRSPFMSDSKPQVLLIFAPLASLAILFLVLQSLADPVYVAGHLDYTLLFMAGGAFWIFGASETFGVMGVSAGADAMRGRNPAAAIAVSGGIAGVALAYAGSNIGNGPTIWTTLVPAFTAATTLLVLWFFLEGIGGEWEAITLDKDIAAGIRLAAFLISAGSILGRAMAGDWIDWDQTFLDFVKFGWPAALLVPAMIWMNSRFAPTPDTLRPGLFRCGVMPALVMLGLAAFYVVSLGMPVVAPAGAPLR